ncbi:MAG: ABC transporter ATP-binding protein, partial [Meiothermus silvanus]|nr:ABC transporter ATP-binding protein [Allomeiothermus silvanus]
SEATLAGALQILFELEDVGLVVYEGRVFAFSAYDKRFVRTLSKPKRRRRHRGAWAKAVRTG